MSICDPIFCQFLILGTENAVIDVTGLYIKKVKNGRLFRKQENAICHIFHFVTALGTRNFDKKMQTIFIVGFIFIKNFRKF